MHKLTADDCRVIRQMIREEITSSNHENALAEYAREQQFKSKKRVWTDFEEDMLMRKFDAFVLDMCLKTGRNEWSIQYKVAHLLKSRAVRVF